MANNEEIVEEIQKLDKTINLRFASIEEKLDNMSKSLLTVTDLAYSAIDVADQANKKVDDLIVTVNILAEKNLESERKIKSLEGDLKKVENDLEDQINQGLRNTLVFKNFGGLSNPVPNKWHL